MSTIVRPTTTGSPRRAWREVHEPVPGVPRYAVLAATAFPFTVLPSGVWRIVTAWAGDDHGSGDLPGWLPLDLYVVVLTVLSELLAMTAFGLVARWGEVFPRWVPVVRGRRVPLAVGVVPALAGAAVLTAATLTGAVNNLRGLDVRGDPLPADFPLHVRDLGGVVSILAYVPLLLWGPLLGVVAVAYWRRRRRTDREPQPCGVPSPGCTKPAS